MSDNCCRVIYALYAILEVFNTDPNSLEDVDIPLIRRLVERAHTSCDCEQMAWVISDE